MSSIIYKYINISPPSCLGILNESTTFEEHFSELVIRVDPKLL